jgi:hypothetical protein
MCVTKSEGMLQPYYWDLAFIFFFLPRPIGPSILYIYHQLTIPHRSLDALVITVVLLLCCALRFHIDHYPKKPRRYGEQKRNTSELILLIELVRESTAPSEDVPMEYRLVASEHELIACFGMCCILSEN